MDRIMVGFVLVATAASACATANTVDAVLRAKTVDSTLRPIAGRNPPPVTPTRIHLDGIKPTDPKDEYRRSTVTATITTQTGMVCTGTMDLSRFRAGTAYPWFTLGSGVPAQAVVTLGVQTKRYSKLE